MNMEANCIDESPSAGATCGGDVSACVEGGAGLGE